MHPIAASGIALCCVIIMTILSIIASYTGGNGWRDRKRSLTTLVKEAARNVTLADQDSSAVMALVHCTLAKAYINATRQMADDTLTQTISGVRPSELLDMIDDKQQNAIAHMNQLSPSLKIESDALRSTGWIL